MDVAVLAAEHYPGILEAASLLHESVDPSRSHADREAAARKLVLLDRTRVNRERACRGGAVLADPDVWEEAGRFKAKDVNAPAPFRFRRAADLIDEPHAEAVVEGMAWRGRVTVVVSESGAGKTFELLGLSAAVAGGASRHGRETVRGSAAYVSYEGDAIGLRLQALHEGGHSLEHVHVLRASDPISPRVGRDGIEEASFGEVDLTEQLAALRDWLAAEGRPPIALVVVDTVRASMTGSEDSSEHVSAYLRAVRRIMATVPGAGCILAHHAGWQDSAETHRKRERGSSAFRGNVDATLYLEVTEDLPETHSAYLTLRSLKVRDDERPAPLRLVRRRVALARLDRHGQPMTSCVIETDTRTTADVEAAEDRARAEEDHALDLKVLRAVFDHAPTNKDAIRELVGGAKPGVSASVSRLLLGRLMLPGRRGEPYRVTPEGEATLEGASS